MLYVTRERRNVSRIRRLITPNNKVEYLYESVGFRYQLLTYSYRNSVGARRHPDSVWRITATSTCNLIHMLLYPCYTDSYASFSDGFFFPSREPSTCLLILWYKNNYNISFILICFATTNIFLLRCVE